MHLFLRFIVLKSDGFGKEDADYESCAVFDEFAAGLDKSFSSG